MPPQRGGGQDRSVHHPQHRAGEDEVRGGGGSLPDGEDSSHPETSNGADRGERRPMPSVSAAQVTF